MNVLRYENVQNLDDYNGESRYVVTIVDGIPVACTCHAWNSTVLQTSKPFLCTHIQVVVKRRVMVQLPPFPNPEDLIGMTIELHVPASGSSDDEPR
jgi:hypothetical protein